MNSYAKNNQRLWLMGATSWQQHCRVVHAVRRNNYIDPSLHGFHMWSDDVRLCAKAKAYGRTWEPRYNLPAEPRYPQGVTWRHALNARGLTSGEIRVSICWGVLGWKKCKSQEPPTLTSLPTKFKRFKQKKQTIRQIYLYSFILFMSWCEFIRMCLWVWLCLCFPV